MAIRSASEPGSTPRPTVGGSDRGSGAAADALAFATSIQGGRARRGVSGPRGAGSRLAALCLHGAADQVVRATVRYQACSASTCLAPAAVQMEMPVREAALAGRALPARTSGT